MKAEELVAVSRPRRWQEPMDASMSDADVCWLRSREPFASMSPKSFPRALPLEGILRNDCRLRRCEPGEIVVREGDYGNSAFLVLAGGARVVVDALQSEQLGRPPIKKLSWFESLKGHLFPSRIVEARNPEEVTIHEEETAKGNIRQVDGRPAVFLQDFDAVLRSRETVLLGPGDLFGEVAAMYRSPRTATVVAETEATLLEIRWEGLRALRMDRGFADTLDAHYREHWLAAHLRDIPLLRHLPESSLARVVEATDLRAYGRSDWSGDFKKNRELPIEQQIESEQVVAREGRVPTELILIRSGFGRVSQEYGASHRTTAYLGKGQVFGLEELAYNALRSSDLPPKTLEHSLRAVGLLDAMLIPAEVFAEEILPHVRRSELPSSAAALMIQSSDQRSRPATERLSGAATDRQMEDASGRSNAGRNAEPACKDQTSADSPPDKRLGESDLLEFIVQRRLNNGLQAMVIDLHRCTRCDDCVNACAAAHDGNPRFVREGVTHGRLQFVQACMQCSDPICMVGCPTGALSRDEPNGPVEIHESICVGCGECASNCVYDNIKMTEVFDSRGRAYQDKQSDMPILKATKCDMCSRQPGGPACANACPHDALARIDLTESHSLVRWLEGRS